LSAIQWRSKGTLRPEARNILAPPPTKTKEFEVKNRCKNAEETKAEHLLQLLLLFFSMVTKRI